MDQSRTKRRKQPSIDGEELCRHTISTFRRLSKLPGPPDRLQTREFRTSCNILQSIQSWIETPISDEPCLDSKELLAQLSDRYSREAIVNYILYFWPVHMYEGLSLISELPHAPNRVLDIGSGAGSYAMSALLHGASDVTLFDQSALFLEAAGDLIGRWGFPIRVERGLWPKKMLPRGPFDLITIGHAIYEMSNGDQTAALDLIDQAAGQLSDTGFLLITTSSELKKNQWLLQLRDRICSAGYEIQAPCIWQGECPARQHGSSPCFAQRKWDKPEFLKELQRGSSIFLNSLKMSYLIIRSPRMKKRELATTPLYRVISPPIEMLGEKRHFLCGTGGKKHLGCRDKTDPIPKALKPFQFLERGSLISFQNVLERNQAVDLVSESTISLVAPCDKPVPEITPSEMETSET